MMRCNTLSHLRAVLLALMMAIGAIGLSACGGGDDDTPPPTERPDPGPKDKMEIIPDAPDLVVSRFSVDERNPDPGASIRLSATVENQGGATSRRTMLRYYLSNYSTISTGDTEVETDVVGALAPGRDSDESTPSRFTAPTRAGTYYYGACVDPVTDESNTSNNCSEAVRVTVRSYGAVAGGFGSSPCTAWAAAVVVNYDNESDATRAARNACRSRGGVNCSVRSFYLCGAVAYGWNTRLGDISSCGGPYLGVGFDDFNATLDAIDECENHRNWENCRIVRNGEGQCNSTAR